MLYLVNHTESTLGSSTHHGDLDAPLAPKGIDELGPVIQLLRDKKLDLIVSPSVERNVDTAALLGSALGVHLFIDEGLRTWKQGAFSGWPHDRADKAVKVYLRHPDVKVPQGESANQFFKRFKLSFTKYVGMAKSLNIILVLNSVSIEAVAGRFRTLRMSPKEGIVYEVGPALMLKELHVR